MNREFFYELQTAFVGLGNVSVAFWFHHELEDCGDIHDPLTWKNAVEYLDREAPDSLHILLRGIRILAISGAEEVDEFRAICGVMVELTRFASEMILGSETIAPIHVDHVAFHGQSDYVRPLWFEFRLLKDAADDERSYISEPEFDTWHVSVPGGGWEMDFDGEVRSMSNPVRNNEELAHVVFDFMSQLELPSGIILTNFNVRGGKIVSLEFEKDERATKSTQAADDERMTKACRDGTGAQR